ncbi:hypothetical protein C5167_031983 [Papaver somniferum]|uniref:Uncharacterized protein n=1 Tax=Papaver somniferum TaxID=3469 RepID=A0A4Y7K860_PAPSO|nr:hypothetical protein C5167_031983 [Papaver somniferum]
MGEVMEVTKPNLAMKGITYHTAVKSTPTFFHLYKPYTTAYGEMGLNDLSSMGHFTGRPAEGTLLSEMRSRELGVDH